MRLPAELPAAAQPGRGDRERPRLLHSEAAGGDRCYYAPRAIACSAGCTADLRPPSRQSGREEEFSPRRCVRARCARHCRCCHHEVRQADLTTAVGVQQDLRDSNTRQPDFMWPPARLSAAASRQALATVSARQKAPSSHMIPAQLPALRLPFKRGVPRHSASHLCLSLCKQSPKQALYLTDSTVFSYCCAPPAPQICDLAAPADVTRALPSAAGSSTTTVLLL